MDWVKEEFEPKSDVLVIAFHSFFADAIDPNKFEWENSTGVISSIVPFKKLFIKHDDCTWWQTEFKGLDGYGPHVLAKFINEEIEKSKAKRVLTMGLSMGGYGAILFGCLCKADLAMAISPQTYLTGHRYKKNNLVEKFKPYDINIEETDLKVVLERYNNNFTQYNIYFGEHNSTDKNMAERISSCNGVKLFPIDSSKHTVAKPMISSGLFKEILLNFIQDKK